MYKDTCINHKHTSRINIDLIVREKKKTTMYIFLVVQKYFFVYFCCLFTPYIVKYS